MTQGSQQRKDLFVVSSERYQDQIVLADAMPLNDKVPEGLYSWKSTLFTQPEKANATLTGPWERPKGKYSEPIGSTRADVIRELGYKALWWRLGEALLGGAFLIGP